MPIDTINLYNELVADGTITHTLIDYYNNTVEESAKETWRGRNVPMVRLMLLGPLNVIYFYIHTSGTDKSPEDFDNIE